MANRLRKNNEATKILLQIIQVLLLGPLKNKESHLRLNKMISSLKAENSTEPKKELDN